MRTGLLLESLGIPLAFPIIYPLPALPHPRSAHPPKPSPQALSLYLLAAFARRSCTDGLQDFPASQRGVKIKTARCDYFALIILYRVSCRAHVGGNLQTRNARGRFAPEGSAVLHFISFRSRICALSKSTVSRNRICASLKISCSSVMTNKVACDERVACKECMRCAQDYE